MNLKQFFLTKNACFMCGRKLKLEGLMLHSTGCNNPNISRYVPLEEAIPNNWNQFHPSGREVCVHGFIGKLKNGTIASVQTLPWDMEGWHCAGTANKTHIGVEICEDGLNDADYFNKVYNEAVEIFAYLCKEFNLNPLTQILCHSEGYKKGIASNHADVMHWFSKHGKSMDTFRNDVKASLDGNTTQTTTSETTTSSIITKIDVKYQVYTNKWLADIVNYNEVNSNGYAGIYGRVITGFRGNTIGQESEAGKLKYKVHTLNGKWLDEVTDREKDKNGDNYAGILGRAIDGIMVKSTKGTAKYRVHLINGSWLPWVNGYNVNDSINGYAGNLGHAIDGIQIEII